MKKLLTVLLLTIATVAMGQTPYFDRVKTSESWSYPAIIYQSNTSQGLPLVIFLHGTGEAGATDGSQLSKMYNAGLPKVLKDGYKPPFSLVMVAPQRNSYSLDPAQLAGVIKDMYNRFKIDTNRIYLTGLSAGGWGCYGSQFNVSQEFAKKIAGIVIIGGATQDAIKNRFNWASAPLWSIVGNNDVSYRDQNIFMVNEINKVVPNLARINIRANVGHGGWNEVYNGSWKDENAKTMWDFLSGKKTGDTVIVTPPPPPPVVLTVTKAYHDSVVNTLQSKLNNIKLIVNN